MRLMQLITFCVAFRALRTSMEILYLIFNAETQSLGPTGKGATSCEVEKSIAFPKTNIRDGISIRMCPTTYGGIETEIFKDVSAAFDPFAHRALSRFVHDASSSKTSGRV